MNDFRIGNGVDVHRLVEGRDLTLCGVKIPFKLGLLGHSDADVAIHALCDALLGAASLRDIGYHFPDTDGEFKDIDSRILLRKVVELLTANGFAVNNVDITIIAQRPKLSPYIEEMIANMAADLNIETGRVSVKATTTEGLGFNGQSEGITALASALLVKD